MLILIALGMSIEWVGIIFLTVPIFVPVAEALGFNTLWFGIIFYVNMQMDPVPLRALLREQTHHTIEVPLYPTLLKEKGKPIKGFGREA